MNFQVLCCYVSFREGNPKNLSKASLIEVFSIWYQQAFEAAIGAC